MQYFINTSIASTVKLKTFCCIFVIVDSTLYTNIYSSLSESESSLSGEESASEESGEDDSDWEEGSQGTSDSEEETGKEEDIAGMDEVLNVDFSQITKF